LSLKGQFCQARSRPGIPFCFSIEPSAEVAPARSRCSETEWVNAQLAQDYFPDLKSSHDAAAVRCIATSGLGGLQLFQAL
jgi:hypothetical protein